MQSSGRCDLCRSAEHSLGLLPVIGKPLLCVALLGGWVWRGCWGFMAPSWPPVGL